MNNNTVNNNCKEYEEILMDIYYGEAEITSDIKEHLLNCQCCSNFWQELQGMREVLAEPKDIPIDYGMIRNVMETAEEVKFQKASFRDLAIFILLASSILGVFAILLMTGYGKQVLFLQGILHIGLPLVLPLVLWRRKYKEGYDV